MKKSSRKSGLKVLKEGEEMYSLLARLFPICRSLTGNGVRETLGILQEDVPLKIQEVPSGTRAFDWKIPLEWNVKDAYIENESGHRIVDFKKNNLHLVGYSIPFRGELSLEELQKHLYSRPDLPDAVPYATSYYKEHWGFCISENDRRKLKKGQYKVVVDSTLSKGSLTYADYIIKGKTKDEILLSTYMCHPSMANNELSGPVVVSALAQWLREKKRRYTYRIVFVPETIGSLMYLSKNLHAMKRRTKAGYVVTCVGDDRGYSYRSSRAGVSLADKAALSVLKHRHPEFIQYSFLHRGSDERQYCSPGIDLPVGSIMRSKFAEYPEYHTSLDNLDLVSPKGLQGALDIYKDCIELLERNYVYRSTALGEPQLGKRGLYPTLLEKTSAEKWVTNMLNVLAYADGTNDLIDISNIIGVPPWELYEIIDRLVEEKLLEVVKNL